MHGQGQAEAHLVPLWVTRCLLKQRDALLHCGASFYSGMSVMVALACIRSPINAALLYIARVLKASKSVQQSHGLQQACWWSRV